MDYKQELLTSPESVENVTLVSADRADLGSIGTSQEGSSTGCPVQDDSKITMEDMHFWVGNSEKSQSTSGASILQPEIEEEQFSFSDLDECKPGGSSSGGSTFPDTLKVDGKEIYDENETSPENGVENSKALSESIDIERKRDISGEQMERLVESLPIMRLQNNDDMDSSPCQPLSQSFDSCSKTSKWDLREDESSSGGLDAEKVAEGSPDLKAFKHVIANPEVGKEIL